MFQFKSNMENSTPQSIRFSYSGEDPEKDHDKRRRESLKNLHKDLKKKQTPLPKPRTNIYCDKDWKIRWIDAYAKTKNEHKEATARLEQENVNVREQSNKVRDFYIKKCTDLEHRLAEKEKMLAKQKQMVGRKMKQLKIAKRKANKRKKSYRNLLLTSFNLPALQIAELPSIDIQPDQPVNFSPHDAPHVVPNHRKTECKPCKVILNDIMSQEYIQNSFERKTINDGSQLKRHKCPNCPYSTDLSNRMKVHMKENCIASIPNKDNMCRICEKWFTWNQLRDHLRNYTHENQKPRGKHSEHSPEEHQKILDKLVADRRYK